MVPLKNKWQVSITWLQLSGLLRECNCCISVPFSLFHYILVEEINSSYTVGSVDENMTVSIKLYYWIVCLPWPKLYFPVLFSVPKTSYN